jgi:hypothetical protein
MTCAWREYDATGDHETSANPGTAKFLDSNSTKIILQWAMKSCMKYKILFVLTTFVKTAENNVAWTRVELNNYGKHYVLAENRGIADFDAV